jgi:hypothetical protein
MNRISSLGLAATSEMLQSNASHVSFMFPKVAEVWRQIVFQSPFVTITISRRMGNKKTIEPSVATERI